MHVRPSRLTRCWMKACTLLQSSKLEVKLSKARQQAEARAAEVSATQMVSAGLQSKLEEIEKSQQAGLLHPAALLGQLFYVHLQSRHGPTAELCHACSAS